MTQLIAVHSFRRGTGKSSIAASLTALLAAQGRRVGALDADLAAPTLHLLFGLDEAAMPHTLNDYLRDGRPPIEQSAYDLTGRLGVPLAGRLFLVPADPEVAGTRRAARAGYTTDRLAEGCRLLGEALRLDRLILDTPPGLTEESLAVLAGADTLMIIMRLDQQDYQGTAVLVDVARKLGIPRVVLLVNNVPAVYDRAEVAAQVAATYDCAVAGVLPHSDALLRLASAGVFALRYPTDPLTAELQQVAAHLPA